MPFFSLQDTYDAADAGHCRYFDADADTRRANRFAPMLIRWRLF